MAASKLLGELLKEELELENDIQDLSECPGPVSAVNSLNEIIRERFKRMEKLQQVEICSPSP